MQCDYSVQVARGSTINLLVTDLNMESSADCTFDYISVSGFGFFFSLNTEKAIISLPTLNRA